MKNPTPEQVKNARTAAGHSQTQAAETIYKGLRTWQQWEKGERAMDAALYELYCIKTGQAKPKINLNKIDPVWPYRCNYVQGAGYVVWRDVFEGQMKCELKEAILAHKVGVFVTSSEADNYADYRNRMIRITGTDAIQAVKIENIYMWLTPVAASGL